MATVIQVYDGDGIPPLPDGMPTPEDFQRVQERCCPLEMEKAAIQKMRLREVLSDAGNLWRAAWGSCNNPDPMTTLLVEWRALQQSLWKALDVTIPSDENRLAFVCLIAYNARLCAAVALWEGYLVTQAGLAGNAGAT